MAPDAMRGQVGVDDDGGQERQGDVDERNGRGQAPTPARRHPEPRAPGVVTPPDAAGVLGGHACLAFTVVAVVALLVLASELVVGPWSSAGLATLAAAGGLAHTRRSHLARWPVRTLLVGSPALLHALLEELSFHGVRRYLLVGCLASDRPERDAAHDLTLGTLAELRSVVLRHDVRLVLMTSEASRMAVFDAMARECADVDVRVCDLSEFYEDTFGYTPIAEINSAWFHGILHPAYRPTSPRVKRAFDVAFALLMGVAVLPTLAVLAWVIRRDGGPALFSQVRIGEGGRPFTMYKLRTMSVRPAEDVSWSTAGDPRVTAIGRHLRRLHLDELPQLWNILRAEMSVVGPRPEQPAYVTRLERDFPFYHRRHALRPGLAGWAQARCGYAGSCSGAAWKLSHDLYYLKRRSLRFDLRIVLESMWQVVAGNQFEEPRLTPVVVRRTGEWATRAPAADEGSAVELGVRECA